MALLKNIKYPNGTEANYHKISGIIVNEIIDDELQQKKYQLIFTVDSYVAQSFRQEDLTNCINTKRYFHTMSVEELEAGPIIPLCYSALKTKSEFVDSENI